MERPEYRARLQVRLDEGKAPHMETLLHYYAYGKPKETVDVTGEIRMPRVVDELHAG